MSGLIVGLTLRRLPSDDHGTLLVALALAEQADSDGESIFPSVDLVATETRLKRRAVQYKISDLVDIGYLVLVKKGGGRHRSNEWRIDVDWLMNQPDLVKQMRDKNSTKQSLKNSAPDAPFRPVDNEHVDKTRNDAKTAQKQCTNSASTGAPNPTYPPAHVYTPPPAPLSELVDAAVWQATRSLRPPQKLDAYRRGVQKRIRDDGPNEGDLKTWRTWITWQDNQPRN